MFFSIVPFSFTLEKFRMVKWLGSTIALVLIFLFEIFYHETFRYIFVSETSFDIIIKVKVTHTQRIVIRFVSGILVNNVNTF